MHFLPYGSVVCVKGQNYPVMIVDWTPKIYKPDPKHIAFIKKLTFNSALKAIDKSTREYKLFDYLACPWPKGYILDDKVPEDKDRAITRIPFNHEDIESVLFIGPFTDVFVEHDKASFEFACDNNMRIADFYNSGKAEEIDVQTLDNPRDEPYELNQNQNDDALLPIGSVVVVELHDEGIPTKYNEMISSVGAPFFRGYPDYEVFTWEAGSVITDDMDIGFSHSRILEVKSLGYVNAEAQAFLTSVKDKRDEFPTVDEIMEKNDEFKI